MGWAEAWYRKERAWHFTSVAYKADKFPDFRELSSKSLLLAVSTCIGTKGMCCGLQAGGLSWPTMLCLDETSTGALGTSGKLRPANKSTSTPEFSTVDGLSAIISEILNNGSPKITRTRLNRESNQFQFANFSAKGTDSPHKAAKGYFETAAKTHLSQNSLCTPKPQ